MKVLATEIVISPRIKHAIEVEINEQEVLKVEEGQVFLTKKGIYDALFQVREKETEHANTKSVF